MFKQKTSGTLGTALVPYGRLEVKQALHRNFVRGMIISFGIHLAIIGTYYGVQYLKSDDENVPMVKVILKYSDLGPPPSISNVPPPPSVSVAALAKPTVGMPVPVPDAEVSAEQTLATQQELSSQPSPALEQLEGGGVEISKDIQIDADAEPGMDEFIPVEKGPQIVKKVVPVYPDMARRAGLEGTVWVKILVDKDGKPKKAAVIKSTTEIFNEPAVEAAMQFLFTPAVMNNGPVKVWVSVPFRFKLKESAPS
jgi:protein TonB